MEKLKLCLAKWWGWFGATFFLLLTLSLAFPEVGFLLGLAYFVGCALAFLSLAKGLKVAYAIAQSKVMVTPNKCDVAQKADGGEETKNGT